MFRIGDKIRIKKYNINNIWYHEKTMTILDINDNGELTVDYEWKDDFVSEPDSHIMSDFVEYDIKYCRKQKVKRILL